MLLLAASALAATMATASLDAPVPTVADLDLLPESGAWPCALTLQVDGMGAITEVKVAPGCPSGLVETARTLGQAWKWEPSAAPHAEEMEVVFKALNADEPEPKAESTPRRLVYLLRPLDLLAALPPKADGTPAFTYAGKLPSPKLPKAAVTAGVTAGTCLVRLGFAADGTVAKARALRCVDALAEASLAATKKLKLDLAKGEAPPVELDLPVRFEPAPVR